MRYRRRKIPTNSEKYRSWLHLVL